MEVCGKWVCTSISGENRWVYDFDTDVAVYAGAEVTTVYFRCQHRQQLRSLLQKYSKIDRLYLVNTTHADVISEVENIVSLGFEIENRTDCEQLENLVSLTHLQSLSINECVCQGAEQFPWTTFSAMTYLSLGCSLDSQCKLPSALQVLHLSHLPGQDCLQDLPALTELQVDASDLYPETIAQLTRLTNLAVAFDMPDENGTLEHVMHAIKAFHDEMFCTIATWLNLRVLLVNFDPSDFQVQLLSALTNLTELEFDSLGKPQCSLMAIQHLCCMSNLQQLHNLHFSSHPHYYQAASSTHCT